MTYILSVIFAILLLLLPASVQALPPTPITFAPTDQETNSLPYALRGSYHVGVADFVIENGDNQLDLTMWYPALNPDDKEETITYELNGLVTQGQALRDGIPDIANGPYPVIYYSHGLFGARLESIYYVEHLTSWGFVVISADHFGSTFFNITSEEDVIQSFGYRPFEIMRLIQHTEELNTTGDYAGLMDMDNLGITGFSFGGYTTLLAGGAMIDSRAISASCEKSTAEDNLFCQDDNLQLLAETFGLDSIPDELWDAVTDARIKAIVPLAPCCVEFLGTEGMAGITAPIMVMAGTADQSAPPELNGILAFENAGSISRTLVLIQDAPHEVYLDIYAGPITRAHDLIKHLSTAFFLAHLKSDTSAIESLDATNIDIPEIEYHIANP